MWEEFRQNTFSLTVEGAGRTKTSAPLLQDVSISFRSFDSARFSIRDTVRIAYCKRLDLRNGFHMTEAKMNDNMFVLSQFDPLDQADEQLPV